MADEDTNQTSGIGTAVAQKMPLLPLGIAAIFAVSALVLAIVVGLVIAANAFGGGKGQDSSQTTGETAGVPGLPDISDVQIEKADCTYGSAPGGCYRLPSQTKYWQAYSSNITGSKCMVTLIAQTSKAWSIKYPDDVVHVGDINAPGHASHSLGEDVDIYTDTAANMTVGGYSKERAIEYGKLWFSTNNIQIIFFNDTPVRDAVNKYAQQENLPGVMNYWAGHENHFHVRVSDAEDGECQQQNSRGQRA